MLRVPSDCGGAAGSMEGALLMRGDMLGGRQPTHSMVECFHDSFRAWKDASRATTHVHFAPIQEDQDEYRCDVPEKILGQRGQESDGFTLSQSNLDALNRDLDALEVEAVGRTLHFDNGPTSPFLDDDERQAARQKIMSRKKTGLGPALVSDDVEDEDEVVLETASANAAPKSQVSDPVRHAVRLVLRQIDLWTWTHKHDGPSPGPAPAPAPVPVAV